MKKLSKLSKVAAVLAGGFSVSGVVLAGAVTISDDMREEAQAVSVAV